MLIKKNIHLINIHVNNKNSSQDTYIMYLNLTQSDLIISQKHKTIQDNYNIIVMH